MCQSWTQGLAGFPGKAECLSSEEDTQAVYLYLIMSQRSWVQELAAKCESLGDLPLPSGGYRDQSALQ